MEILRISLQILMPDWKMWVLQPFLTQFPKKKKYANSNWWKKWKLCVNDDTFFVQIESTGSEVIFSDTRPGTGTGNVRAVLACIHYFMQIAEDFGCLWRFSNIFGNLRICLCCLRKTWHTREKNITSVTTKKIGRYTV